jgi:hypothetical protein
MAGYMIFEPIRRRVLVWNSLAIVVSAALPSSAFGLTETERAKIIERYYDDQIAELRKQRELDLIFTKGMTADQIKKVYATKTNNKLATDKSAQAASQIASNHIGVIPGSCEYTSGFYVRRDRLDTFQFLIKL